MYPETVEQVTEDFFEAFKDGLAEETSRPVEWFKPYVIELLNQFFVQKFIHNLELRVAEDEVMKLFNSCIGEIVLQSLKEKGLLNSVEDESGDDVYFLTKEGKEYTEDNNLNKEK